MEALRVPLPKLWTRPYLPLNLGLIILFVHLFPTNGEYIPPGPKYRCPLQPQIWPCKCLNPTDEGISLDCNDVSLATLSAALAYPIAYKTPVTYLKITNLSTQKLYGSIFDHLNLTKLTINSSPLKEIYSDVFYNTRHTLKHLELVNTSLLTFPIESVQDLDQLETLVVDKHQINNFTRAFSGLESLKNLQISNGHISEFYKETFAPLGQKLTRLDLHGNLLKTVPKDAFQHLKNLEYLDIAYNQFDKLDPSYFFHLSKLTWFNGSHNQIPEFRRGAFARNGFLRVIYLTHNKISKIDAAAFRGMRLLVRLYLSDNLITDVGRAAFNSLQRIKTIDLARNQLKLLDFQMFLKLPFCEEIFLQENNITRVKSGAFNELAYVQVNMSHNQITVIEKESFVNCINITVLDMSYNLIDNFTKGAFDELSYADEWRLQYNRLKFTGDIPLKFMTGMRILNVSNNLLEEVSRKTFPNLYELHSIDFSYNNLSKIHSAVFGTVFSLRFLDLRHNNLTELQGSTFGALPTVLELHLDHNKLKSVSTAAFSRLVSLRELTLSNNQLKKVFQIPGSLNDLDLSHNEIDTLSKAWPIMNALQRLDLSSNKLGDNLSQGSFEGLQALSKISLASNNISFIPQEALSDLRTVQHIDLSHNQLTSLSKAALGRLPVVFHLLLSNNNISSISHKAFEGLLQLQELDLSSNSLSSLVVGSFANLVSMKTLNLSRNFISRTENGTNCLFEDNLSLYTLDLSYNSIKQIYPHTFPQLQWTTYTLANVNLSHNQLTSLSRELLRGTKTLKKLDLSHNKINEIKPNVISQLLALQSLDLSYNNLHSLETQSLGPQPPLNFRELNLQNNYLKKFPLEVLAKAPFSYLNVESNRIKYLDTGYIPKIKNGSRILTNSNPLGCDCRLIFVKRFFEQLRPELSNFTKEFFEDYNNFECIFKDNKVLLKEMEETDLVCDYSDDPLGEMVKVPLNLDVEIRSFVQIGSNVEIRWRVKSKMDILGFQIVTLSTKVREVKDREDSDLDLDLEQVLEYKSFGYSVRGAGVTLPKGAGAVCLLPTLSSEKFQPLSILGVEDLRRMKRKVCHRLDLGAVAASYANSASKINVGRSDWTISVIIGLIVYLIN